MKEMKKIKSIFCILLAFAMIFLCACGDSSQDDSEEEANSVRYNVHRLKKPKPFMSILTIPALRKA